MEERCRIPIARPSDGMLRAGRGICCGADDGSLRFAIFAVEENEPCYDDQSQTTLSGTCGPDFRQPDDARSGARRGRVPVRPGRTAVDRSDLRRVGQRRRARQPPGDRRDLRSGARLPSSDGLRRGGRVAAGALCRADRFAAARSARHGLLRQFGQRGRRRGAQTGQALYRPYRAGLLPECLSRQYGRFAERHGRRRVPQFLSSAAARHALHSLQRARRPEIHYLADGLRNHRARSGRGGSSFRKRAIWKRCAAVATRPARCSFSTRYRPGWAGPARSIFFSSTASCPIYYVRPRRSEEACRSEPSSLRTGSCRR